MSDVTTRQQPATVQTNFRAPYLVRVALASLAERWGSETTAIVVAVDRLAQRGMTRADVLSDDASSDEGREQINLRLPVATRAQLDALCERYGVSLTRALVVAVLKLHRTPNR